MKRTALGEQVIRLAQQGYSVATIVKRTGFPAHRVRNSVSHWRKTLKAKGEPLPTCICGLPGNHRDLCFEKPLGGIPWQPAPPDLEEGARCSSIETLKKRYRVCGKTLHRWLAEKGLSSGTRGFVSPRPLDDRIEALAAEGYSIRTIAFKTGKSQRSVRHFVRKWRERLAADGEPLPPCKCGGLHDHSYFCSEKICGEGIGSRMARQVPDDFEEVAPALSVGGLSRHYRTGHAVINRWLGEFPDIHRPPISASPKPLRPIYRATSGIKDPIYNLIERCVPTSYAPDVRADIISAIYLAVLDGTLPKERLLLDGRSILYQVVKSYGIMYQTAVSLDKEMGEDEQRYIDTLADDNALSAFDRIFEEQD